MLETVDTTVDTKHGVECRARQLVPRISSRLRIFEAMAGSPVGRKGPKTWGFNLWHSVAATLVTDLGNRGNQAGNRPSIEPETDPFRSKDGIMSRLALELPGAR